MTKYSAMLQIKLMPHPSRSALQTAYIPSPGSGRKSHTKKVNKGVIWKAFLLCNYPDSQLAFWGTSGKSNAWNVPWSWQEKIAYRAALPPVLTFTSILFWQARETFQCLLFLKLNRYKWDAPHSIASAKLLLWAVAERRKGLSGHLLSHCAEEHLSHSACSPQTTP